MERSLLVMNYGSLRQRFGSKQGFEGLVEGNRVRPLHDGVEVFPEMLAAIENAQHEILLEMYWFASDETGWRFARALVERAKAGVEVAVIYDAIGSLEAEQEMWTVLREAGASVLEYNPIAPWRRRFRFGRINRRNHRKMLIVDNAIGFTGGVNIGDPWAPESEGGEGWRDDMIRIEGPAVEQMRRIFLHGWKMARGEVPTDADVEEPSEKEASSRVRVLANHFFGERRAIRSAYLERIDAARRCIYITNSYFVPDAKIRRALARAAARGVDVRVLLPGESDVAAVYYAGRKLYGWLLERGVKLHEWRGVVLHAKTAVVDGSWCTVGTYNLDYRSWRFNLEVTAAIEDESVAGALERRFLQDLERSPAVNLRDYRYRSLGERFLENFFYLFRKLL